MVMAEHYTQRTKVLGLRAVLRDIHHSSEKIRAEGSRFFVHVTSRQKWIPTDYATDSYLKQKPF
jgi:hypothetical protein